ncbi:hypothetical protein, partial [Pseudomonas aeruginosa]|uniref:hypothetical protein n=1 Tax=Pseudomonas aeruginosa TaxID=287 RepID=UPI0035B59705
VPARQVGTPATGDDRAYGLGEPGRGDQRRRSPGAGPEVPDIKATRPGAIQQPAGRLYDPPGEEFHVEAEKARPEILGFLLPGEQVY